MSGIGTNLLGSDPLTTTNVISDLSYRAFGAASSITYGNNRVARLSYNTDLMRLLQMGVNRPNGTDWVMLYQYNYWENGLLSGINDWTNGAASWSSLTYNGRNQLVKYQAGMVGQGPWMNYSVDDWGNLASEPGPNGSTKVYSYALQPDQTVPATNRLSQATNWYYSQWGNTSDPPVSFSYNAAGQMTAAGSTSYQWDAAGRLKSVNNGALGSYGYDGNSKRVKKVESGVTTYYVVSSVLGAAMEVTSAGVQRAYVMNGSSIVAQLNPNGQFYWVHTDHLGSGRRLTDTSGNVVYTAQLDPYGKVVSEWSSPTNLNTKKFTGYERDGATGLD